MERNQIIQLKNRAVELGNSGNGQAASELVQLLQCPAQDVRRCATSALGKLAGLTDAAPIIPWLLHMLRDTHPQVRQYAIKALKSYGAKSHSAVNDLNDMANNPSEKEYNRRDAKTTVEVIHEALRIAEKQAIHTCQRCEVQINEDEYARSIRAFDRPYCDKCFDEVYLRRRNFDAKVELNKTIQARDGTIVQSKGERAICEWLSYNRIPYRYDERIKIIQGYAIRPDFYLPEFDLYIEYWGMDTIDYKIGMLMKQKLYQQEGKKLISIYPEDIPNLHAILSQKLSRHPMSSRSDSEGSP